MRFVAMLGGGSHRSRSVSSTSSSSCCVLFLFLVVSSMARAQPQQQQQCSNATTCNECLNATCAWVPALDECLDSCDIIADTSCFTANTTIRQNDDNTTIDDICAYAANQLANAQLCSNQTSSGCDVCVNTTLISLDDDDDNNSTTTCQWFPQLGYCGSACDMNGCGEFTCDDSDSDNTTEPSSSSSCTDLTSCQACLDNDNVSSPSCAWAPEVEQCLESCDVIADTLCFPSETYTASDVCTADDDNSTTGGTTTPTSGGKNAATQLYVLSSSLLGVAILTSLVLAG